MKWNIARKFLHSVDRSNIKVIARKQNYKLSGKEIEAVFRMVRESGEMTSEQIDDIERYFIASVRF